MYTCYRTLTPAHQVVLRLITEFNPNKAVSRHWRPAAIHISPGVLSLTWLDSIQLRVGVHSEGKKGKSAWNRMEEQGAA